MKAPPPEVLFVATRVCQSGGGILTPDELIWELVTVHDWTLAQAKEALFCAEPLWIRANLDGYLFSAADARRDNAAP